MDTDQTRDQGSFNFGAADTEVEKPAPRLVPAQSLRRRVTRDAPPQASLALDPTLPEWVERARVEQPKTRGDCHERIGDDACPFVSCHYHIYAEALVVNDDGSPSLHSRMRKFERMAEALEPEEWGETCGLRVADKVVLVDTETGKRSARSADGEPFGAVGPIIDPVTGEWYQQADLAKRHPASVDAASLARWFELSREQVRKILHAARERVRRDPIIQQEAIDRGINLLHSEDADD